jgi:hypothetical protein
MRWLAFLLLKRPPDAERVTKPRRRNWRLSDCPSAIVGLIHPKAMLLILMTEDVWMRAPRDETKGTLADDTSRVARIRSPCVGSGAYCAPCC